MPRSVKKKKPNASQRKIILKAIQIASLALVSDDPATIGRLAIASSLLAIATSLTGSKDAERLLRTASKLSTA